MAGQSLLQGIPNLNVVYEDDLCTVLLHRMVRDDKERFIVHVDVLKTTKREILDHYYDVIESLFQGLRDRGVTEVETWVREGAEMDFAQFYGFDQFLGEIKFGEETLFPPAYILKKDL